MTDTALEAAPVTADDIIAITQEVWSSFLLLDAVEGSTESDPVVGQRMTGVVNVSGAWQGSVVVECPIAHAVAAAEAMFAAEPGSLSSDEVGDALGELTNMVGGNIKSLLPAPAALSIPSVTEGESYTVRLPGAVQLNTVALVCAAGVVHVSLWKVRNP